MFSVETTKTEDSPILTEIKQQITAEQAGSKVLGNKFYKDSPFAYTIISNIAADWVRDDYLAAISVFDVWLSDIEPKITAIEGEIGFHVGPKKNERRTIKLDIDGSEHGSRGDASTHYLEFLLKDARQRMFMFAVRAICNVSKFSAPDVARPEMSDYKYIHGWRRLLSKGSNGIISRKTVEKVNRALRAMKQAKFGLDDNEEPVAVVSPAQSRARNESGQFA